MTPKKQETDIKILRQKLARAKLRESFLRALIQLNGVPCNILTYERTSLNATFAGPNADGSEFLVRNLETPSNVRMDSARLRTPDILAIRFDEPVELP